MELIRFFFENTDEDYEDSGVDIFALVKYPNNIEDRNDLTGSIEDAIYSYCDGVEDWQPEDLVSDVLDSFNLEYEIVSPITICV